MPTIFWWLLIEFIYFCCKLLYALLVNVCVVHVMVKRRKEYLHWKEDKERRDNAERLQNSFN